MKPVNLLLASSNSTLREGIVSVLGQERDMGALGVEDVRKWTNVLRKLREEQPEVLMLELGPVLMRLDEALREVKACTPRTKVVAVHSDPDPSSILAALRSGAHEFVHPPWDETLRPALDRVLSMDADDGRERNGKVVGFVSAKGGCGATTIACHIAADLHRQAKRKILLADLDLSSGLVGFAMKDRKSVV